MISTSSPALSVAASTMRTSVFAALQVRIDAYRASGGDLIPLQIGDTHLSPPAAALVAQRQESARQTAELARYQPVAGLAELRVALAQRHAERGWRGLSEDNVHVGCGCTHALFCAARAMLNPGDEVLVATPYWPLIAGVLRTVGAVAVEVPLTQRLYTEPQLNIAALLDQKRTAKTRAIYLITPNNPDGHIYSRSQLEQFAAYAKKHNLWVMADEVYADYAYDAEHVSIASFEGMAARTITSYSLSKSHGLAGARIGYIVGDSALVGAALRMSNHTVYSVPFAMQRVALAAIQTPAWTDTAKQAYRSARSAAAAALDECGIAYRMPHGGSFFFLDLQPYLQGRSLNQLLETAIQQGVLLAPGEAFGQDYAGYARLCFTGVEQARVVEGIARFARALGVGS